MLKIIFMKFKKNKFNYLKVSITFLIDFYFSNFFFEFNFYISLSFF
jgi:hypothetical protein